MPTSSLWKGQRVSVRSTHGTRYGPSKRHTHSHGTATSRQTCSPEPARADVWRHLVVGLRPHPDGAANRGRHCLPADAHPKESVQQSALSFQQAPGESSSPRVDGIEGCTEELHHDVFRDARRTTAQSAHAATAAWHHWSAGGTVAS